VRRSGLLATVGVVAALAGFAVLPAGASGASANTAALQVALRALRLYSGSIDGITGPLTRRGTRRFQRRRGLEVDGIAGPRTRRALGRRGRPRLGSRPLQRGRRGWDVAGLQFLLNQRGFGPGGFDGGFGPRTSSAVRRFQRAAGLSVDGVAGPSTLRALRRRTLSGSGSPRGPVRFFRPVDAPISDRFGAPRPGGRRHTGIDLAAGYGTPVGAGGVGVVTYAEYNSGGYGRLVIVKHRLGFESWYAHLSRISVSPGDRVSGGSRIGYVGSTGNSTGPHLHFEVRRYGTPINPVPYLLRAVAARAEAVSARAFRCRPNADAWGARDADPEFARIERCP
jgi:peptidoglycan hydrolase-like protein with peptidoglycan-binding domain